MSKKGFYELAKEAVSTQTQEVAMHSKNNIKKMTIGIPKEIAFQENRVGLSPHGVQLLVSQGHEVLVENHAGINAKFYNEDYESVGAKIVYEKEKIFESDTIIKISFPTEEEIGLMKPGITLLSALHSGMLKKEYINALVNKKVTALCFEYLKDESGSYPVLQAMSEIAGSTSILIAAEYLSNINNGKGVMLGGISGIPPSEVVILGAGTVGLFACRAALGLGAEVKVFDNSLHRLRRLQNDLGTRIYTSIIQPITLSKALRTADVAIGALRAGEGLSPNVVTEEMVMQMRNGSVIVDVSIDQGGVFETSKTTTHTQPIFEKHEVIHYCVPNIPSRVARTASYAINNIFAPMLADIGFFGGIKNYIWEHEGVRHGTYIYKGNLTNKHIAERFKIPYKELDLLIAAQL